MPTTRGSALLTAFVISAAGSPPVFAADAGKGEALAKTWCTACHLIGPQQSGPTTEAPPFSTVARSPDFDAARLAFFLLDPHPKMPNMQLTQSEASDLAAYIATLK
jgi:mono/diheme cytochrome c family protein